MVTIAAKGLQWSSINYLNSLVFFSIIWRKGPGFKANINLRSFIAKVSHNPTTCKQKFCNSPAVISCRYDASRMIEKSSVPMLIISISRGDNATGGSPSTWVLSTEVLVVGAAFSVGAATCFRSAASLSSFQKTRSSSSSLAATCFRSAASLSSFQKTRSSSSSLAATCFRSAASLSSFRKTRSSSSYFGCVWAIEMALAPLDKASLTPPPSSPVLAPASYTVVVATELLNFCLNWRLSRPSVSVSGATAIASRDGATDADSLFIH